MKAHLITTHKSSPINYLITTSILYDHCLILLRILSPFRRSAHIFVLIISFISRFYRRMMKSWTIKIFIINAWCYKQIVSEYKTRFYCRLLKMPIKDRRSRRVGINLIYMSLLEPEFWMILRRRLKRAGVNPIGRTRWHVKRPCSVKLFKTKQILPRTKIVIKKF